MIKMNRLPLSESTISSTKIILLVLFLACLIAYANCFQNHFMLDDNTILFGQRGVLNKTFWQIFTYHQGRFYRPVGHIPLWFFSRLFESHFIGYHIANFLLFVSTVCFLFAIVRKITSAALLSFLSALLYAVHPLNGMLPNYITASVIAVFVLSMQASFWFFMRFSEQSRQKDYLFSVFFFALALLSHEMAIMLPVYLANYLYFIKKESWEKFFRPLTPFVLFLIAWLVFRSQDSYFYHQTGNPLQAMRNGAAYFSTWMDLLSWYVSNLFLPNKNLFLWSNPYGAGHLLRNVVVFITVIGLSIYALSLWKKSWQSFFLVIFCTGLFPSLLSCFVYFPTIQPLIEPHWFYFSEMGFFVLAGWALLRIVHKNSLIGGVFMASVMVLSVIYCWDYNARWQSQEKYSRYWLFLNKGDWTPYYGLGRSLMDKGDYAGAASWFLEGVTRCRMLTVEYAADLGHCLDKLGYNDDALRYLRTAINIDKDYALTYHYLGLYQSKRGNIAEAQTSFRKAIELDPQHSP